MLEEAKVWVKRKLSAAAWGPFGLRAPFHSCTRCSLPSKHGHVILIDPHQSLLTQYHNSGTPAERWQQLKTRSSAPRGHRDIGIAWASLFIRLELGDEPTVMTYKPCEGPVWSWVAAGCPRRRGCRAPPRTCCTTGSQSPRWCLRWSWAASGRASPCGVSE